MNLNYVYILLYYFILLVRNIIGTCMYICGPPTASQFPCGSIDKKFAHACLIAFERDFTTIL